MEVLKEAIKHSMTQSLFCGFARCCFQPYIPPLDFSFNIITDETSIMDQKGISQRLIPIRLNDRYIE